MKKLLNIIICITLLSACKSITGNQSVYSENISALKKLIDSTGLGNNYNGSILIADDETILYETSYGFNAADKEKNTINSKYDIASMGKMFTAVAILQLIEDKKISLDQQIENFISDYPNEDAKKITIKQLLSHTSGLGDFFGPEYDMKKNSIKSLNDFLPFFINDPLEFKPGERMRYSNAGFIILGLIIEKASGMTYNSYVTENILKPIGMLSTGPLLSSAGGGKSTVKDFHKFAIALKNNTIINSKSFSIITTDHFNHGYGFGMSLREFNGKKIYGHNGGAPGVSGELDMVKGESLIIVTLSNRSPMEGWAQLRNNIRKEFFGNTPEIEEFLNTEQVVKTYKEEGYEKARNLLTKLGNKISDKNTFRFAEQYARQGQPEKAIHILKLIVQAYPDRWYPYSFLADFQLQAGQKEAAIRNYKKSLEFNPKNDQAINQLKELEKKN